MRNLGLLVALWLTAILPTGALALGLGEIEVKSFLNQPLEAEIEVISARPGEIDDLLVSLASRDAFSRAGLSRPRHLSDLRFTVRKNEEGDEAVIVVSTKDGVKEPFLNFLIEADWAKGRVLREFTILLDPPFYAEQPPPLETASQETVTPISDDSSVSDIVEQTGVTPTPIAEPEEAADSGQQFSEPIALSEGDAAADVTEPQPMTAPEPITEPEPLAETSVYQYAPETSQQNLPGEVLVNKGNTLWSIASRYKDDAHTMSQVMLAFQRANPGAFKDGNINNMRAGAILRVPDTAELNAMGEQEAYAEVLVQNGLWDEYVARVTGVSPAAAVDQGGASATAGAAGGSDEASGELSLLLPADGSGESAGTGDGAELNELRNKLAMAEEELDASRIENRELESRIAELQARLSKVEELQKMVEIEDDSLAQLQADAAAGEQSAEAAASGSIDESATEADSSEQALIEELLAEEAAAQAEEQASQQTGSDGMIDDEPASDTMGGDEVAMSDGMSDGGDQMATTEGQAASESQKNQQVTTPAPVIVTETTREPSIFDGILPPNIIDMIPSMPDLDLPMPALGGMFSDPLTLGALGGVVLLLLVLLIYRRKKNETESGSTIKASDEEDLFDDDDSDELTPIHLADVDAPDDSEIVVTEEESLSVPDTQQTLTSTASLEAEVEQDDFASTAIISAGEMPEMEAPSASPEALAEQDDVLNEVDVYLAYGLYDNAEELLNSNLAENPDRADYRSKLLDTYFATKNSDAFVKEAENLKSMGAAATPFWDRVQIMGYELAPDNPLFSDAKDSDLSAADLEISKPQEADFDLGASDDADPSFSTTDFNLGEDDTGNSLDDGDLELGGDEDLQLDSEDVAATQVIQQVDDLPDLSDDEDVAATQVVRQVGEMPELSDDDDTNLNQQSTEGEDFGLDLPDDIGDELEFSMADDKGGDSGEEDSDDLDMSMDFDIDDEKAGEDPSDFDLGDDLGLSLDEDNEADDLGLSLDDDGKADDDIDFDMGDDTGGDDFMDATAVVDTGVDSAELETAAEEDSDDGLDLGLDDTSYLDESVLRSSDFDAPVDDTDDDDDISVIDFGGEDFEEPTALVDSIDDLDDDSLSIDVDMEEDEDDEIKTGTFSPGDFDEPTALTDSVGDLDDVDDLMLPDDVDEVSTKLDLARAFIDMGDTEGARGSLEEVIAEGNEAQKEEAQALLDQI